MRKFRILFLDLSRDTATMVAELREAILPPFEQRCRDRGVVLEYVTFNSRTATALLHTPAVIFCDVGGWAPGARSVRRGRPHGESPRKQSADTIAEYRENMIRLLEGCRESADFVHVFAAGETESQPGALRNDEIPVDRFWRALPQHRYAVARYDGSRAALYRAMVTTLDQELEARFPHTRNMNTVEVIGARHEALAFDYRTGYRRVPTATAALNAWWSTSPLPIIVSGDRYVGKTMLLVNWSAELADADPELLVVRHFVEAYGDNTDHGPTLHHLLWTLKSGGVFDGAIPSSSVEAMEGALLSWAASTPRRPVLLVLDGLDRLRPAAQRLHWLPHVWPNGVRIAASAADGAAVEAARTRGWQHYHITELPADLRADWRSRWWGARAGLNNRGTRGATEHPAARAAGSAQPDTIDRFDSAPDAEGHHEDRAGLDGMIDSVLNTPGAAIDYTLGRARPALERRLLRLVWASRRGLTMHELSGLLHPCSERRIYGAVNALRDLIVRRGDVVMFTSPLVRDGVDRHLGGTPSSRRRLHEKLGTYFERHGTPLRRGEELPTQWLRAGNLPALRTALVDPEVFTAMMDAGRSAELLGFWRTVEDTNGMSDAYREAIDQALARTPVTEANVRYWVELLMRLAAFLSECGTYPESITLLEQAEGLRAAHAGADRKSEAELKAALGEVLRRAGSYARAIDTLRAALTLLRMPGADASLRAQAENDLGLALREAGAPDALEHFRRAVAAKLATFGPEHPATAETLNDMALVYQDRGDHRAAITLLERALAIQGRRAPHHPARATYLNNLAGARHSAGHHATAFTLYAQALLLREDLLGPLHHHTLLARFNVAVCLHRRDLPEEALDLCRRTLADLPHTLHDEHPHSLALCASLGQILRVCGRADEAEPLLSSTLGRCRRILGNAHRVTAACAQNLGAVLRDSGRHPEALEQYRSAVASWRAVLPPKHPRIGAAVRAMSGPARALGEYWDAATMLVEALDIECEAYGAASTRAAETTSMLADTLEHALDDRGTAFVPPHAVQDGSLYRIATLLDDAGRADAARLLLALCIADSALRNGEALQDARARHARLNDHTDTREHPRLGMESRATASGTPAIPEAVPETES